MMRRLALFLLLLTAAALAQESPVILANPALARFSDRVTFLASFDQGIAAAEMAVGRHEPRSVQDEPAFAPGLFGQALAGGMINFQAAGNLPLAGTGTILFWVSPLDWAERDDEGYMWWFQCSGRESGLLVGRQGEIKSTRRATVYYHATTAGHKPGGAHVGGGGWRAWPNGSWHLIVITWQLGRMSISVDGRLPSGTQVGRLTPQEWFTVGRRQSDGHHFLIDDFMILDQPLNAEEIAWIWRESRSARGEDE